MIYFSSEEVQTEILELAAVKTMDLMKSHHFSWKVSAVY